MSLTSVGERSDFSCAHHFSTTYRVESRNDIEIVDAASLDPIYALTDADASDNLTVYDNYNSLLVRTTHPLHGGSGEVTIQSIGKPPHVVYVCRPKLLPARGLFPDQ